MPLYEFLHVVTLDHKTAALHSLAEMRLLNLIPRGALTSNKANPALIVRPLSALSEALSDHNRRRRQQQGASFLPSLSTSTSAKIGLHPTRPHLQRVHDHDGGSLPPPRSAFDVWVADPRHTRTKMKKRRTTPKHTRRMKRRCPPLQTMSIEIHQYEVL